MEQIRIQYFSCSPYYVGEEKITSKTQELKTMVYKLLKDLQNEIHLNFIFEEKLAYGLKGEISSPFQLVKAALNNDIVIVDGSLEEDEFKKFNLDFGANYECITPAVMSLDNVLILSRTQIPLNLTPLRSNVKRMGKDEDKVNTNNNGRKGYQLEYSNEQIVSWLKNELTDMNNTHRLVRDANLRLNIKNYKEGIDELVRKQKEIFEENTKFIESTRKEEGKVKCFISYRGCYYNRKKYGGKYNIPKVKEEINAFHKGNADITVLPEGCLSNELMPEVRRWAFVSYIDRLITECDEFWIFETKHKEGESQEFGYWDSWWCMGEILTILRNKNDVLNGKLKVMKFDPDKKDGENISQVDISTWHSITSEENKELARYYANSDFLEAGYESVAQMRAMRRWPRFLRKLKFKLMMKYIGSTYSNSFEDADFENEYKFEDFESSIFSHVYDKSFMENRILTCGSCTSLGATEESVRGKNFIWRFLNINGEYTKRVDGLSAPEGTMILTPQMFEYIVKDERKKFNSFVKAGGAIKCLKGHLSLLYRTTDKFYIWWTPRNGKRTGPNNVIIETVPVYSSLGL